MSSTPLRGFPLLCIRNWMLRVFFALGALLAAATGSSAQISITVDGGRLGQKINIAVLDLAGQDVTTQRLGAEISAITRANLVSSGLFNVQDPSRAPQSSAQIAGAPDYNLWSSTGARAVVAGRIVPQGNQLRVEYRLFDIGQRTELNGLAFTAGRNFVRDIAHLISDNAYEELTGAPGHFSTRIVFVSESGDATNRSKRLAIMDQDGARLEYLTPPGGLVLRPSFSPVRPEITYLSYEDSLPKVYLYNIDTRQQEVLGQFPGMSFSPRFSPDGQQVAFSISQRGQSDIYVMDLRNRSQRQLTTHPSIDTSPSYSPDGRRIVFESERSGEGDQQLYIMNSDGSNVRRISFGDGRYAAPVWSPDGEWIAFTKISGGNFSVGVMRTNGTDERILSSGFLVEGPSWAPNGRMITYYKQEPQVGNSGGDASVYVVDIFGNPERRLPTQGGASDPAWSPLTR